MRYLKRWGFGLLVAIATVISVMAGWQVHTFAQAPTEPQSIESSITLESAGLTLEEMADGVYGLIASTDFPPADFAGTAICNGAIVIGSDGALVIDPFQNEALADLLFSTVESLTDLPVRYVVNTHYHFDHTGGNLAAAQRTVPILGRGPIREWMATRNAEFDPTPTLPTVIVNGTGDLWLGDRQIYIQDMEGHSGGTDMIVYVPDADVLVAGDLLFHQRIPYLVDGDIRLWQETLDVLMDTYPTATVLPGHGSITDAEGLQQQKEYVDYLEAIALEWRDTGITQEEAMATTNLPPEYAEYKFQGLFPTNIEAAYQQITAGHSAASVAARHASDSIYVRGL